eukprot:scaffold5959_cov88-Skeletonema_dohrnii-CCMP3373.AAC.7
MSSYGSTEVPDAGLWWFRPPFRSIPSPPPSPWLLCSKWCSLKVLTKKGAKADLDCRGFPFPVGFAPQKQLRARLWKHHTLH